MSRLGELLDRGNELIITGEAPVIDGGTLADYEAKLQELAPWCDAMNATDNTAAHAHASNVAMAIAMQRVGVEPILQVVCRDKNRIAQQADIMGAALHGVENICCLTGDYTASVGKLIYTIFYSVLSQVRPVRAKGISLNRIYTNC